MVSAAGQCDKRERTFVLLLLWKESHCFLSSDELAICCTNFDFFFSLPQIGRGVHEPHKCKVRYLPLQKYITSASTPMSGEARIFQRWGAKRGSRAIKHGGGCGRGMTPPPPPRGREIFDFFCVCVCVCVCVCAFVHA